MFHFPPPLQEVKELLDAGTGIGPMMALINQRRNSDEGSLLKQVMVALMVPFVTAIITAGVTAYVTQVVLVEKIREMEAKVELLRLTEKEDFQRVQDWIMSQRSLKK